MHNFVYEQYTTEGTWYGGSTIYTLYGQITNKCLRSLYIWPSFESTFGEGDGEGEGGEGEGGEDEGGEDEGGEMHTGLLHSLSTPNVLVDRSCMYEEG